MTFFLLFAGILTTPQPLLGEEVADLVPDVPALAHATTGWLEQVGEKSIAHFRSRAEEGCFAVSRWKTAVGGDLGRCLNLDPLHTDPELQVIVQGLEVGSP